MSILIQTWILFSFFHSFVYSATQEISLTNAQNLVRSGKLDQALFVLDRVAPKLKNEDPAAEYMIRAEVFCRKNEFKECLNQTQAALAVSEKSKSKGLFSRADIESLANSAAVQLERIDFAKAPAFTQKDANRAANTHRFPRIEMRNNTYRVRNGDQMYRIESIDQFYKMMRDAVPAHVFKDDIFTLRIGYGRAQTDHVIYDEKDEMKIPVAAKDDEENYKSVQIQALTFVAPLFVYQSEFFEDNLKAPSREQSLIWMSLDLKNGRPADILDFVDVASFADALRRDTKLKGIKGWPPVNDDKTPLADDDLVERFRTEIEHKETIDFAIYDYNPHTNDLMIRVLATPSAKASVSNASFILYLTAKPTLIFQKRLKTLNPQRGFFMKDAPRL